MLKIKKGQVNQLTVTASELTTISNPIFEWEFTHSQSRAVVTETLNNISQSVPRYDLFILDEGVNVTFPFEGQYTYKITEEQTGVICEIGRAEVFGADPIDHDHSENAIDKIYNGELEN
jgi:hypothetical protein